MTEGGEWVFLDWNTLSDPDRDQALDSGVLTQRLGEVLRQRGRPAAEPELKMVQFGRYIEALRKQRGWSRPQLAQQAGLDPVAVALLEMGALTLSELSPFVVKVVAGAFGLLLSELVINPRR